MTSSCKVCSQENPSRQKEPQKEENVPPLDEMEPMDQVSADLFNLYGKDYLIMVDRASSYPWVRSIRNQSAGELVAKVEEIFLEVGHPGSIRTDGAKNFTGGFEKYLAEHEIKHKVSSAYFPEGNGIVPCL